MLNLPCTKYPRDSGSDTRPLLLPPSSVLFAHQLNSTLLTFGCWFNGMVEQRLHVEPHVLSLSTVEEQDPGQMAEAFSDIIFALFIFLWQNFGN